MNKKNLTYPGEPLVGCFSPTAEGLKFNTTPNTNKPFVPAGLLHIYSLINKKPAVNPNVENAVEALHPQKIK